MKKALPIVLTLTAASMLCLPAFADQQLTAPDQQATIDVKAQYVDNVKTPTVYSVDISWGAMDFTYTETGTREWNPADHTYSDEATGSWKAEGNTITVTNHSNAEVTADFAFQPAEGISGLTGKFSVPQESLAAGEVDHYNEAESVQSSLTLEGSYTEKTEMTTVGSVTVTIR